MDKFFDNVSYSKKVVKYLRYYYANPNKPTYFYCGNTDSVRGMEDEDANIIGLVHEYLDDSPLFIKEGLFHTFNNAEWERALERVREKLENRQVEYTTLDYHSCDLVRSRILIQFASNPIMFINISNVSPDTVDFYPDSRGDSVSDEQVILSYMGYYYSTHTEQFISWLSKIMSDENKATIMEHYVNKPEMFKGIRALIRS